MKNILKRFLIFSLILFALTIAGLYIVKKYFLGNIVEKFAISKLEEQGIKSSFGDIKITSTDASVSDAKLDFPDGMKVKVKSVDANYKISSGQELNVSKVIIDGAEVIADPDKLMAAIPADDSKDSNVKVEELEINNSQLTLDYKNINIDSYIKVQKASLNLAKGNGRLEFDVKNFPVELLEKALKQGELKATGVLNGKVIINAKNNEYNIEKADFSSASGGVIAYNSPENVIPTEGNTTLTSVNELIRNFTYDKMNISVSGDVLKDSHVNIFLSGSNPKFYNGRNVELNIKLDGNVIDALLSSYKAYNLPKEMLSNEKAN